MLLLQLNLKCLIIMYVDVVYSEAKEEPRRTSSFFFSKQPTPAKPSKVKEM